jgi:methylmalonyl-CoA mutase cobalamin-binding subunit
MSTDDQSDPRGFERSRTEHVSMVACQAVSTLSSQYGGTVVRQVVIQQLVRSVLDNSASDPARALIEMRADHVSAESVIDTFVPEAARKLGELWVDDEISFADVTMGSLRLQALLTEAIATVNRESLLPAQTLLRTLIIIPEGEQHIIGAQVLASQLRRMGCEVASSYCETEGVLKARLMQETTDLILISCSGRDTLATIRRTVQIIRAAIPSCPAVVLGGSIKADKEELKDITGVDLVTNVVGEAVSFCAQRTNVLAAL